ncbi:hypothetical protein HG530_012490 [Fusarium avenaceum]|nr:hypothetical protein HG530_012490 [Fusarium avenaceum]
MTSARDPNQLLGFSSTLIGILAEFARLGHGTLGLIVALGASSINEFLALGQVFGRYGIARLASTTTPVRKVDRDGDEALLGELGGVQVGALLFDSTHWVADDDGGGFRASA